MATNDPNAPITNPQAAKADPGDPHRYHPAPAGTVAAERLDTGPSGEIGSSREEDGASAPSPDEDLAEALGVPTEQMPG